MGHQTKKAKANQITDLTGKLLRKNEELQKKKEESNGCKMKKTGDKDFWKKPRSVEQLKNLEENKTDKTSKLELNKKNKEERQNKKPRNKDAMIKEKIGKLLKKSEDRKKKLECRLRKRKVNRDLSKLAKLLLSYKTELPKLLHSIFKKKC